MSTVTDVIILYSDRGGLSTRRIKRFFDEFCTNDSYHQLEIKGWGGAFKKFFPDLFLPYLASIGADFHQMLYCPEDDSYTVLDSITQYFSPKIYERRRDLLTISSEEFDALIHGAM